MARINTSKTLHNSYFDGANYDLTFNSTSPMAVHPMLESQYDFAVTYDPELLNDRKDSAMLIHQIFSESEFNDGRFNVVQEKSTYSQEDEDNFVLKVPKEDTKEVFSYVKAELLKRKNLNPIELVIAINEYFDFNYDYVYKKVLTMQEKQELLEDYYKNEGMKAKLNEGSSIKLF